MSEQGDLEATREETDASLADERVKTDALLEEASTASGRGRQEHAGEAVAVERAETDDCLLAERHEVDSTVGEAASVISPTRRSCSARHGSPCNVETTFWPR